MMRQLSSYIFIVLHLYSSIVSGVTADSSIASTDSVSASVGSRVFLLCRTSVSAEVLWSFQPAAGTEPKEISIDGDVRDDARDRYELNNTVKNEYNLVIRSAQTEDSGKYVCDENNGIGDRHIVILNVSVEPLVETSSRPSNDRTTDGQQYSECMGFLVAVIVLGVLLVVSIGAVIAVLFLYNQKQKTSAVKANRVEREQHRPLVITQLDDARCLRSESATEDARNIVAQEYRESPEVLAPPSSGGDVENKRFRDTFIFQLTRKHHDVFVFCATKMVKHIKDNWPDVEVIIGLNGYDSRGDILAWKIAEILEKPFAEMVESGKSYIGSVRQHSYKSEIEGDNQEYTIEMFANACTPNQKVVIVDNAVTTGATMKAAVTLAKNMDLEVLGCMCLLKASSYQGDKVAHEIFALYTV